MTAECPLSNAELETVTPHFLSNFSSILKSSEEDKEEREKLISLKFAEEFTTI